MTFANRLRSSLRRGFSEARSPTTPAPKPSIERPRIISLSMVKNEQDIIEPFIRHNARFLDCMVIIDNASVDDTRQIVVNCARETGKVIVSDSSTFAYTQAEQMTRLLNHCQTAFFADFIVLLDADEFISARDEIDFRANLAAIPSIGVGLMPWQTYVLSPTQKADTADDPPRTIRLRRATETPLFRKAVIRLDGLYRDDLFVWQGSHNVVTTSGKMLPSVDLDVIPMLHFPVRSREQLCAKAVVGWMAYLAKNPTSRQAHEGPHWRDTFDEFVNKPNAPDSMELYEISMRYAQDRPTIDWQHDTVEGEAPIDYVRRYSTGLPQEPLSLVARSWERSLLGPRSILDLARPPSTQLSNTASSTSFDAAWHWDNLFVDVPPFRFISDKYAPEHVLDVGCGIGAYLKLFKNLGAKTVVGVDGIPSDATALSAGEYIFHDLAQPFQLDRVFDLVICTEVAEHIDGRYSEVLLDNIMRHAGSCILFSAAEPEQPGHGHINCKPIRHWLERFAARGWYPELMDSLGVRSIATMSWLRRNLVVFRRGEPTTGEKSIDALVTIGALPFVWYSQEPGIRDQPFSEALPSQPLGYRAEKPVE